MRPQFRVVINDNPLPERILNRISSLTINDRAGVASDSLTLDINDDPTDFLTIPSTRALIQVWGGYAETGLSYFGSYSDCDVEIDCLPYRVRISAKGSDQKASLRATQERHWDGRTIAEIIQDLAAENDLEPDVDPDLGAITLPWVAMQGESALAFGERIAGRVGGVFAIKDGKMLLARRHDRRAGGAALSPYRIGRAQLVRGMCRASEAGRDKAARVAAEYHDENGARRQSVSAPADPTADPTATRRLRETYADADEASRAAAAEARALTASAKRLSLTMIGDPRIRAGALITLEGVRPGLDGERYTVEQATHRLGKRAGYELALNAVAEPPASTASPDETPAPYPHP